MHALRTLPAIRAWRHTLIATLLAGSVAIPLISGAALAQENGGTVNIDVSGTNTGNVIPAESEADLETYFAPGGSGTVDYDRDGLPDEQEVRYGLDPRNRDSDGDWLPDGGEFYNEFGYTDPSVYDTDSDWLGDGEEVYVYGTNPWFADTDQDGYHDGEEVRMGRNPLVPGW